MLVLVLVLVVVLQFEGTREEELHLYHSYRHNVVLPCNSPSSLSSCSDVTWFYNKDKNTQQTVWNGADYQISHRAYKFNLSSSCSLIINYIDNDDAGLYTCRPGSNASSDGFVYLNVLTIYEQHVSSVKDEFTVKCSLERYSGLDVCPENSFRWLDETGTELTEGIWFDVRGPRLCVSSLTVKDESDRGYTCQFVEGNSMKIEVNYTPLSFKAENRERDQIYHRAGDEAVLPCNRSSSFNSCSSVDWLYERNEDMNKEQEVQRGIVQSSSRSARLSLDRNCSLIINNINAEDAGLYTCQPEDGSSYETEVYLNLLIISSYLPAFNPTKNEVITLFCYMVRSWWFSSCPVKSLLWVDETGRELTGEGDGYKSGGQIGCVSHLTVNLQSSRRFTCQFVEGNEVKIEAQYGSEGCCSVSSSGPPASSPLSFIMLTLKITGLILMVGITVGIIRTRGRKKPQKDINVRFAVDDDTVSFENDGERSAAAALH
ncbi:uncharacterized protein LOC114158624 isoform X1 [Xiphophorus couchianus]|uniref:uncharacterized protein LOC114158624 isoform X1 n=1 Tax=Xiphophorus couchianus TaxID=32473 RepID=UPI0010167172|nr:uncharacterized protein LOC114158624 isoform X1 [Xiphophorus couchianus]